MAEENDSVDRLLSQIDKAAEIDAGINYRIMDNHLKHSDRVIASQAALKLLNEDQTELLKTVLGDPQ